MGSSDIDASGCCGACSIAREYRGCGTISVDDRVVNDVEAHSCSARHTSSGKRAACHHDARGPVGPRKRLGPIPRRRNCHRAASRAVVCTFSHVNVYRGIAGDLVRAEALNRRLIALGLHVLIARSAAELVVLVDESSGVEAVEMRRCCLRLEPGHRDLQKR